MPKNKLTDYSATNASNTDVGGINIDEGMLPSDVNNAIREVMTHLKDFSDGTSGVDVLNLQDDDASASIKIQAPATVTATTTFTLPDGDGSSGQVLQTNGTGTLSWTSNGLANVVEDTTPQLGGNLDLNGNDITGNGDINNTGTITTDGLTVDGNILVSGSAGGSRYIIVDDNASYTGTLNLQAGGGSAGFGGGLVMYGHSHATYPGSVWIGSSTASGGSIMFGQGGIGPGTERMRLTESGRLGIGTSSPYSYGKLTVEAGNGTQLVLDNAGEQYTQMYFLNNGTDKGSIWVDNSLSLFSFTARSGMAMNFYTNNSEAVRIDSSGNLLVGKTANSIAGAGVVIRGSGELFSTRAGDVAGFNRLTTDGPIVQYYKDGSVVGGIGVASLDLYIGEGTVNLRFDGENARIFPATTNGAVSDGNLDLGADTIRFKDLYLSGRLTNDGTGGVSVDAGGDVEIIQEGTGRLKAVGGIFLGGTASANLLDDYEEGTWNVTIINGSLTPTVTTASYTKIGNRVFLSCHLVVPTNSESLYMALGGLPFATSGDSAGSLAYTTATTSDSIGLLVQSSAIYFYKDGTPYATSEFSNKQLRLSAQYRTAA